MRRAPRNAPLWIVLSVVVVVLAVTITTYVGSRSPAKPVSSDVVPSGLPVPAVIATGNPAPETTAGESRQAGPSEKIAAATGARFAPSAANDTPPSTEPVGAAGMVVGIDPETGKVGMPSREFRDALRESHRNPALSRSMEGLRVIHRPDGSRMIDLKGRFQEYAVIRISPDGRKEQVCVQGPDVEAALQGKASASPTDSEAAAPTADPAANTASEPRER